MGLLDAIFGSNDKCELITTREIPVSEVPEWVKKAVNDTKHDGIGYDEVTLVIQEN